MDSSAAGCYNSSMMQKSDSRLARRPYGHDGVELSIIGLGGIVVMKEPQDTANRLVAEAIEAGVNYFDVAPTYGDAEIKLGNALKPYRKDIFLACKTAERTARKSREQLEQSLEHLHTDHLDLYQLHALNEREKDLEVAFGLGGAMETFIDAKKQGLVRHLGFSSHSPETALLAMDRYDFDSVLFPINFACWHYGIGPQVVKKALEKNMSILAIKAMALTAHEKTDDKNRPHPKCWYKPISDPNIADLAVRFTLSKPVTAALPPGDPELFKIALKIARNHRPLNDTESAMLQAMAKMSPPVFPKLPE